MIETSSLPALLTPAYSPSGEKPTQIRPAAGGHTRDNPLGFELTDIERVV